MSRSSASTDYKVGDRVTVPVPLGRECGVVVEDRGNLGPGGRRLYYVEVPNHPYTTDVYLVDEDQIRHVTGEEQAELEQRLDPAEIKDFLIHGGLFSMLVHAPKPVWLLRHGPKAVVLFTFIEGYSKTGGEFPPMHALKGEKIHAPKRDAVVRFVKSFGLSQEDAEEVIRKVGVVS